MKDSRKQKKMVSKGENELFPDPRMKTLRENERGRREEDWG